MSHYNINGLQYDTDLDVILLSLFSFGFSVERELFNQTHKIWRLNQTTKQNSNKSNKQIPLVRTMKFTIAKASTDKICRWPIIQL